MCLTPVGKHLPMNFYAFDSFQGLTEPTGIDAVSDTVFKEGDYACGVRDFMENIARQGVDLNRVRIVPGCYKDMLTQETEQTLDITAAAVIWVDCDLYSPAMEALNFVTDYLVDGTVLVFDDWFCFKSDPNRGEQRAFAEWLGKNPSIKAIEFHKFGWHGNSFIINR
jgi:O-methyltransferase